MEELILLLAAKFPAVIAVFSAMGVARLVFKPLFSFLHAIADATPSPKDNELLQQAEDSKIVKGLAYLLDLVASIKVGPQAK